MKSIPVVERGSHTTHEAPLVPLRALHGGEITAVIIIVHPWCFVLVVLHDSTYYKVVVLICIL